MRKIKLIGCFSKILRLIPQKGSETLYVIHLIQYLLFINQFDVQNTRVAGMPQPTSLHHLNSFTFLAIALIYACCRDFCNTLESQVTTSLLLTNSFHIFLLSCIRSNNKHIFPLFLFEIWKSTNNAQ